MYMNIILLISIDYSVLEGNQHDHKIKESQSKHSSSITSS